MATRKLLLASLMKRGSMRRACLAGILGVLVVLLSGTSHGATFVGSLSGSAENPPSGSPGTGSATVTYDPTTHLLTVDVSFSGLLGLTTAAHIHCCVAPPGNAGVATQVPTFLGFPLGVTSGTYAHTFDLTQAASFNPSYVTASGGLAEAEAALASGLANNMAYLDIHTNLFPGGEIRSFLVPLVPPTLSKVFGASSISLNGTTSLTFTLINPEANPVALTGVAFTDNLPAGLVVATPSGLTSSCGGVATAVTSPASISLTGGTIATTSGCTVGVNVTGTIPGIKNNTSGSVTSTNGGTGNTASASITVIAPPVISKAFGAADIVLTGGTSLTFTLTNPAANTVALTGVAFTDNLPAGLLVATPNVLTNTCGGTATAVAGSGSISLTGGTIATNSNCTVGVNVTGTTSGDLSNTTGAVSSTNGGTGNTATALVNVIEIQAVPAPTLTEWGMIMLTVLLGIGSVIYLRRRRSVI